MHIVLANLTAGGEIANHSSWTTASIAPTGNALILLTVDSQVGAGTANTPTITGAGLTWVQIATVNTVATRRLTLFRGMGTTPTSGTFTIDFGGQTQSRASWSVDQATGTKITGANGADAVVRANSANQTGTHTGIVVTLSAFSNTENATFGCVMNDANIVISAGANFTVLSNPGGEYILTEWTHSNQTTVDFTWASTNSAADYAIAVELADLTDMGLLSDI